MSPSVSIAAQVIAGWFVADLITACVHLTLDKLHGTRVQSWPLVGQVITEFKEHHDFPWLMSQRGFWESSRETLIASALAVVFACIGLPWFWGTVTLGTGLCQAVHKYAHRQDCPLPIQFLQATGLLISWEQHARHHDGRSFNRNFGILNGWSNLPLNGILWLMGV